MYKAKESTEIFVLGEMMNKAELSKILKLHAKWLIKDPKGIRADLSGSNLSGSNLRGSNLRESYLPPPTLLLLCDWGEMSDKLTTELMRYDASNHPDPTKFDEWAKGGQCPYGKGFQRCANFQEKRNLWKPGKAKSAYELVLMLFKEKNIKQEEV